MSRTYEMKSLNKGLVGTEHERFEWTNVFLHDMDLYGEDGYVTFHYDSDSGHLTHISSTVTVPSHE